MKGPRMNPDQFLAHVKDRLHDLKARHGDDLHLLSAAGEHVVATVPSAAQFQQFKDYAADERKRTRALETLTRACVVYPDAEALDVLLGVGERLAAKGLIFLAAQGQKGPNPLLLQALPLAARAEPGAPLAPSRHGEA